VRRAAYLGAVGRQKDNRHKGMGNQNPPEWFVVGLPLVGGVIGTLWSLWLWRNSATIEQSSHIYRVFENHYQAWNQLFGKKRDFERVSERYFKHWARVGVALNILLIAFGILAWITLM